MNSHEHTHIYTHARKMLFVVRGCRSACIISSTEMGSGMETSSSQVTERGAKEFVGDEEAVCGGDTEDAAGLCQQNAESQEGMLCTGGLATVFEKKSRRMELATYCLARCIESFGLCLVEWGLVSPRLVPPRMDVAFFSVAAACIMHCYSDSNGRHRDVFRSKYLNVLDFIFGNSGEVLRCHTAGALRRLLELRLKM